MRRIPFALLVSLLGVPSAIAQAGTQDPSNFIPRYTVALGYQNVRANAPPGSCDCFDMNGGFASVGIKLKYWLSAAGEVTGGHAKDIGPLGQDLTLATYTAGPRITFRGKRFLPFAQALFGAAHGSDSYFPKANSYTTSATSFALSTGGGLDVFVNHRIAIRPIEAQYLRTSFPNGTTNFENHLTLGAGVVFQFRDRYAQPHIHRAKAEPPATLPPTPEPAPVAQAAPEPPPAPPTPEVTPPPTPATAAFRQEAAGNDLSHPQMKEIYFDFNSAALRPEAQDTLGQTATFLNAHPAVLVSVEGFTDQRGPMAYNFDIGSRRSQAAREALVARGVSGARLQTRSLGKSRQLCTEKEESCFQANRRVTFSPR